MTFQNNKKCIMYTAPCGRTLRSCEQLVLYLFNTRSKWTIDMFEYDHFVDCLREFVIENANITIKVRLVTFYVSLFELLLLMRGWFSASET